MSEQLNSIIRNFEKRADEEMSRGVELANKLENTDGLMKELNEQLNSEFDDFDHLQKELNEGPKNISEFMFPEKCKTQREAFSYQLNYLRTAYTCDLLMNKQRELEAQCEREISQVSTFENNVKTSLNGLVDNGKKQIMNIRKTTPGCGRRGPFVGMTIVGAVLGFFFGMSGASLLITPALSEGASDSSYLVKEAKFLKTGVIVSFVLAAIFIIMFVLGIVFQIKVRSKIVKCWNECGDAERALQAKRDEIFAKYESEIKPVIVEKQDAFMNVLLPFYNKVLQCREPINNLCFDIKTRVPVQDNDRLLEVIKRMANGFAASFQEANNQVEQEGIRKAERMEDIAREERIAAENKQAQEKMLAAQQNLVEAQNRANQEAARQNEIAQQKYEADKAHQKTIEKQNAKMIKNQKEQNQTLRDLFR